VLRRRAGLCRCRAELLRPEELLPSSPLPPAPLLPADLLRSGLRAELLRRLGCCGEPARIRAVSLTVEANGPPS
jgi:hypothetical protein